MGACADIAGDRGLGVNVVPRKVKKTRVFEFRVNVIRHDFHDGRLTVIISEEEARKLATDYRLALKED